MTDRIWGEGKPGARPCLWPDEEAPFDWDDPPVCRRKAVKAIRFEGALKAIPTCASCLQRIGRESTQPGAPARAWTVEEVD